MASPIQIDPTDKREVMQWEQLFGSPQWQKFMAIQQARVDECKENAWLTFRDEASIARNLAMIEVLSSIVEFQSDLERAFAQAQHLSDDDR